MRNSVIAVGSVGLAVLAACGGADATRPVPSDVLDAVSVGATASRVAAIMNQPILAAVMAGRSGPFASIDRIGARVPLPVASASRLVPDVRGSRAPLVVHSGAQFTPDAPAEALIADSLLGKTLVSDTRGRFVVDPSLTGAPSNGVRFVISKSLGYADVTSSTAGAASTVTLDVKNADGSVVMHDVATTSYVGTDGTTAYAGYVTDGTDRIDYTVSEEQTGNRLVLKSGFGSTSLKFAAGDTIVVNAPTAGDTSVSRVTLGSTVVRMVTPTVPDPGASGVFIASDTAAVMVNGVRVAQAVTNSAGARSVIGLNGSTLSADDTSALMSVTKIAAALEAVIAPPMVVGFWLSQLAVP